MLQHVTCEALSVLHCQAFIHCLNLGLGFDLQLFSNEIFNFFSGYKAL